MSDIPIQNLDTIVTVDGDLIRETAWDDLDTAPPEFFPDFQLYNFPDSDTEDFLMDGYPWGLPQGWQTVLLSPEGDGYPVYDFVANPEKCKGPQCAGVRKPLVRFPVLTPIIYWPRPTAINFPTALSATQLNAQAYDPITRAVVAGTFTYKPVSGTVLPIGVDRTLVTKFVPTNLNKYRRVKATNLITVNDTCPTICTPPLPTTITVNVVFNTPSNVSRPTWTYPIVLSYRRTTEGSTCSTVYDNYDTPPVKICTDYNEKIYVRLYASPAAQTPPYGFNIEVQYITESGAIRQWVGTWGVTTGLAFSCSPFEYTAEDLVLATPPTGSYTACNGYIFDDDTTVTVGNGSGSVGTTSDCSFCPGGAPLQWAITIAGISSAAHPTLANLNGTFTLDYYLSGFCIWQYITSDVVVDLRQGSGSNWVLTLGDLASGLDLSYTNGTWACLSSNILTADDALNSTVADAYPATLTAAGV